jgi:hypothetical protein
VVDGLPPLDLLSISLRELNRRRSGVCSFTDGDQVWEARLVPNGFQVTRVVRAAASAGTGWHDEPLPFPSP